MGNKKGFTLAELMVVVAIIGVLVAVSVPIFNSQLEKSREATDLANVRSAYAQVMTEAIGKEGIPEPVAVFLKQTQDDCRRSYQSLSAASPSMEILQITGKARRRVRACAESPMKKTEGLSLTGKADMQVMRVWQSKDT